MDYDLERGHTHSSNAYKSSIIDQTVLSEFLPWLLVIITLLVSWLFESTGVGSPFGIFVLLIYALFLYFVDMVLAWLATIERSDVRAECQRVQMGANSEHVHLPIEANPHFPYILIWLGCTVILHLVALNNIYYSFTRWLLVPLFATSALNLVFQSSPKLARYKRIVSFAFGTIFLLSLLFPSTRLVPHFEAVPLKLLRIAFYFAIAFKIEGTTERPSVSLAMAVSEKTSTLMVENARNTHLDADAVLFCHVAKQYDKLDVLSNERWRFIVAQSAWVLIATRWDFVVYGVALLIVALIVQRTGGRPPLARAIAATPRQHQASPQKQPAATGAAAFYRQQQHDDTFTTSPRQLAALPNDAVSYQDDAEVDNEDDAAVDDDTQDAGSDFVMPPSFRSLGPVVAGARQSAPASKPSETKQDTDVLEW